MEIKSEIRFGNIAVKEDYTNLQNKQLKKQLDNAFRTIENNAFCGIQIPKRLIPKGYQNKLGEINNLWKYNLPNAFRLIYTIKRDNENIVSIILEWMSHKDYEKRFRY